MQYCPLVSKSHLAVAALAMKEKPSEKGINGLKTWPGNWMSLLQWLFSGDPA